MTEQPRMPSCDCSTTIPARCRSWSWTEMIQIRASGTKLLKNLYAFWACLGSDQWFEAASTLLQLQRHGDVFVLTFQTRTDRNTRTCVGQRTVEPSGGTSSPIARA